MGNVLNLAQQNGKTRISTSDHDLIFWMHDVRVAIPNDTWTPFPWNNFITTLGEDRTAVRWGLYARPNDSVGFASQVLANTTIAVGSNGAILPQGTINVASTAGFSTQGYLLIRASTLQGGGATDTVVRYTGLNATQFTGCTLGTGTLATSDIVRQGNMTFEKILAGSVATAEVAWEHNATGVRGCRFRFMDGVFNFDSGTDVRAAAAAASPNAPLRNQTTEQPISLGIIGPGFDLGMRCEVYQNSGGVLNTFAPLGLAAPRLVVMNVAPTDISAI